MAMVTSKSCFAMVALVLLLCIPLCSARSSPTEEEMEKIQSKNYFSEEAMLKASAGDLTEEECAKGCLEKRACKAAVYRQGTKSCFWAEELPSIAQSAQSDQVTYLKRIQQQGRGRQLMQQLHGRKRTIVIVVVLVGAAILALACCCFFRCFVCCI